MASSQTMASAAIVSRPECNDADENGPSHAVGVLTLQGEADAAASCNDLGGEADSGYASGSATTDNQKGKQPQEFMFQSRSLLRKPTRLRAFDSPLPVSVKNRFDDLVELLGQPLSDYISKCRGYFTPISIKLKLLGDTESRAEPWIVVMSDKSALKKIKQFFYQPSIKKQWQGEMDDPDLPRFQIYFYDRPPRQNGATQQIPVYYRRDNHLNETQTLSGHIIMVNHPAGPRFATLGGMITVIAGDGKHSLYGMTVGHIAMDESQATLGDEGDEDDEEDDGLASSAGDSGEDDDDDSLLMEVELDLSNEKELSNIGCAVDDSLTLSRSLFGFLHSTSYDEPRTNPDLDWGLVELTKQSMCLPNNAKGERSVEPWDPLPTSHRDVTLRSGISGYKKGVLSGENSFLMTRARGSFVKTRNLKLSDDTVLQPGDCGSWVVDRENHEILGHVVASDDFGEAYVIPMWDVLKDISINYGAHEVRPTLERDILDYRLQQEKIGITPSTNPFQGNQKASTNVESHLSDHRPSRESLNNTFRLPGSPSSSDHFRTPEPFLSSEFTLPPIFRTDEEIDLELVGDGLRPLCMAVGKHNFWGVGQVLRVRFLGGNQHVHEEVKKCAKEWEKYANISFTFVNYEPSDIRISFSQSDGWHSVVGKTALEVPANKPTMNLTFKSEDNPTPQMPLVLHELGHALGCIHEHSSSAAPISWNEEYVYSHYKKTGWQKQTVDENVLQRYNCEGIGSSKWDSKSIMTYHIPSSLTKGSFSGPRNCELSQKDKEFIAKVYPKSSKSRLWEILSRVKTILGV